MRRCTYCKHGFLGIADECPVCGTRWDEAKETRKEAGNVTRKDREAEEHVTRG